MGHDKDNGDDKDNGGFIPDPLTEENEHDKQWIPDPDVEPTLPDSAPPV